MTGPARPRHAASLVLTRRGSSGREVLMGRRRKKAKFIPDAFVFPGGAVEPQDYAAPVAAPPAAETLAYLQTGGTPPRLARALCAAAMRETEEETGLRAGGGGGGRLCDPRPLGFLARAITPVESPIRFHARFLHWDADAAPLDGRLTETGELTELHWVALDEALRLPIIDVTDYVLRSVAERFAAPAAWRPALYTYRRGRPVVRPLEPKR